MKCFLSLQLILVLTAGTPFACPAADDFPDPVNTQAAGEHPPSPQEMLELFELPPGFNVTLFAGEPNVQQPIAFDFDDRGRIWVAENYSYGAHGEYDADHRDRVIILHDTDGDGQHDERKVFWDKGWMLTGLTWGFGGLWILNDGSLSFIPDKDADDVPDSEPVEMLNGWTKGAGHNFVNGLLWGPDGWLYGRHGITETSLPGRPDVPKEERQPMNCGIWRFHPTKHTFEIVCHGTTNPWGLDYNESGDMFMSNNVIGHLWHVIPGAHYERMFGQDFNPHLYELMGQAADHYHWDHTGKWTESRDGHAEDLGGGHSHCGLMIYQGQNFPEEYHGKAFMFNTHGRCINVDRLERKGSSYVAKHEPNFLKVNTPWFRGIELKYGPRGCVYLTDWSDNGECHDHDGVHRTSGRIYRIAYGEVSSSDNATLQFAPNVSLDELLNQVLIPKDHVWHARRATRLIMEQVRAGKVIPKHVTDSMRQSIALDADMNFSVNACWLLNSLNAIQSDFVSLRLATQLLGSQNEQVRAAAVRLVIDSPDLLRSLDESLISLSKHETSAQVRMNLAVAIQHLPFERDTSTAARVVAGLTIQSKYAITLGGDDPLRRMIWYGLEPNYRIFSSWNKMKDKQLTQQYVRRWSSDWDDTHDQIIAEMKVRSIDATRKWSTDPYRQNLIVWSKSLASQELLAGVLEGLRGRSHLEAPHDWHEIAAGLRRYRNDELDELVSRLSVLLNDGAGLAQMRDLVADRDGDHASRSIAIHTLASAQDDESIPILLALLNDRAVYVDIAKALAAFDDPRIPAELLKRWNNLRHGSREAATDTMVSRKSYAGALAGAIDDGRVDSADLTATHVRQLLSFHEPSITKIIEAKWGIINDSSEARTAAIGDWKRKLTPELLSAANQKNGAALFKKSCANCHKLYGEGGKIGPDLTGSNRNNMDYLLGNVIDPSAVVPKQFTTSVIALASGRVITGVVVAETAQTIRVQTDKDLMTIAASDIDERTRTNKSLMPDGLLDPLTEEQVRDLIAYVRKRR